MSYTETTKYTAPSDIGFYQLIGAELYSNNGGNANVTRDVTPYYIGWTSPNRTFQIQYRIRRRLTPARAIVQDPTGEDVWTGWSGTIGGGSPVSDEWGAWQGVNLDTETASNTAAAQSGWYYYNSSFPFPYDFSDYDRTTYQVRVRVLNASTKEVSAWAYAELDVVYAPIAQLSAERNLDGTVTIAIDTNWLRDENLLHMRRAGTIASGKATVVKPELSVIETVDHDCTVTIPAAQAPDEDYVWLLYLWMTTADGGGYSNGFAPDYTDPTLRAWTRIPITENPQSQSVPDPDNVTILQDGTVEVEGGPYDTVYTSAEWTDEDGNAYSVVIPMTYDEDLDMWTGQLENPPYDRDVTVRVSGVVSDEWKSWEYTLRVESLGYVSLDWGDSHFQIHYNTNRAMTVQLINDAVSVSGSALPVSVYSTSRTNPITIIGTFINPDENAEMGDAWMKELEILNEPHDWVLRAPNGMRRRVMVESYQPVWQPQTANTIMDVTINMQEVADD